ncbi:MAG: hypothetical protein R2867_16155 [Caldilineaceae bacterium]
MLTQRGNLVQTIMVNVTVLMAVAGIVILIANNLATIPAQLYITVFATLALVLTLAGLLTGRRGHANSTAILGGYAGIVLGLAIFAGSHFYGFATFIPDQLLLWMAGLTLLAFLFASTWQMGLVGLLNLVWLYTAFLYGTSYWPGVILNACLYWFAWQRRTTVALFLLAVANSVVLINLYGYDLVHPNHFPLTFATVHLVVTFACFGMLSGLAGITWRNIPPWSPWLRYSQALIWLTTVAGIGLLLFLITPNSWMIINQSYDGGLFAIVLGMALYMISAVFVFSRPTMPGTRTRFGLWTIWFSAADQRAQQDGDALCLSRVYDADFGAAWHWGRTGSALGGGQDTLTAATVVGSGHRGDVHNHVDDGMVDRLSDRCPDLPDAGPDQDDDAALDAAATAPGGGGANGADCRAARA